MTLHRQQRISRRANAHFERKQVRKFRRIMKRFRNGPAVRIGINTQLLQTSLGAVQVCIQKTFEEVARRFIAKLFDDIKDAVITWQKTPPFQCQFERGGLVK